MGRLVSIVVVTWNSARYLPRCLSSVSLQTHGPIEILAVDNASADDSVARVRAACPGATILQNRANEGFSRAVNQAVDVARGEFILLLNPDAALESDYVERLVAAFDAAGDDFGLATGKLMQARGDAIEPSGLVDSKGIRMTRTGRHLDIGQGRPDGADERGLVPLRTAPRIFEVFGVSGAAAMLRRSFVDDVAMGGELLDDDFFAFREDADLAWRGRIFGWRALHAAGAVAYHVRTVTPETRRELSPAVNMHSVKNRFLLRLKNEGLYLALRNLPFELARDILTIGAVLTVERTSLPGLAWVWANRRRVLEKRRAIQSRRRVPDRALARWFA